MPLHPASFVFCPCLELLFLKQNLPQLEIEELIKVAFHRSEENHDDRCIYGEKIGLDIFYNQSTLAQPPYY